MSNPLLDPPAPADETGPDYYAHAVAMVDKALLADESAARVVAGNTDAQQACALFSHVILPATLEALDWELGGDEETIEVGEHIVRLTVDHIAANAKVSEIASAMALESSKLTGPHRVTER